VYSTPVLFAAARCVFTVIDSLSLEQRGRKTCLMRQVLELRGRKSILARSMLSLPSLAAAYSAPATVAPRAVRAASPVMETLDELKVVAAKLVRPATQTRPFSPGSKIGFAHRSRRTRRSATGTR
jgi:hypothetical protein